MRFLAVLILTSAILLADPISEFIWMIGSKDDYLYVHLGTKAGIEYAKIFEIPVFPADPILEMTGCDPILLKAMIRNESNFRIHATSPTGALGVSQFVRSTAKWLKLRNPYNPIASSFKMCEYVRYLSKKFKSVREILWAYHDGEGAVKKRGPSRIAKSYADTIMKFYRSYKENRSMEWFKDRVVLRLRAIYDFPLSYELSVSGALSVLGVLDLEGGYYLSDDWSGLFWKIYLRIFHDFAPVISMKEHFSLGVSMWDIDRGMEVLMSPGYGRSRLQIGNFGLEMDRGRFSIFYRMGF